MTEFARSCCALLLCLTLTACGGGGGGGSAAATSTSGGAVAAGFTYSLISAGDIHNLAVRPAGNVSVSNNGTLFAWGTNNNGQLGDSSAIDKITATQIGTAIIWPDLGSGGLHSLGVQSDGTLWSWGLNNNNQLGDGTTLTRYLPTKIVAPASKVWRNVAAGGVHSLGLVSDGSIWGWGGNPKGQVGVGGPANKTLPTSISTVKTWTAIAAGGSHSAAVRSDLVTCSTDATVATVVTNVSVWGDNALGQLGLSTATFPTGTTTPSCLQTLPGFVTKISAGTGHTLAILNTGQLWGWGDNTAYQLGYSPNSPGLYLPALANNDTDWVAVSAGGTHSMAIKTDGSLWGWGSNADGQLGVAAVTEYQAPTRIGSSTWKAVSAGKTHTLAIKSDGTLWAWGRNSAGQLGLGTTAVTVVIAP